MALMQITFMSSTLGMNTEMNVFMPENPTSPTLKTVYLLHGMSDNQANWSRYTSIERFLIGKNVAVIMPTTHMGWYTDMECGYRPFFTHVADEVPAVARRFFPQLSDKREDNFIAGLSMGGYGALKIGLARSECFEKIACYSGAYEYVKHQVGPYWDSIFGDTPEKRRKHTIEAYVENIAANNLRKPPIYMWCGTEDFLLEDSRKTHELLVANEFDITYAESAGNHEWRCWEEQFLKSLDFFGI